MQPNTRRDADANLTSSRRPASGNHLLAICLAIAVGGFAILAVSWQLQQHLWEKSAFDAYDTRVRLAPAEPITDASNDWVFAVKVAGCLAVFAIALAIHRRRAHFHPRQKWASLPSHSVELSVSSRRRRSGRNRSAPSGTVAADRLSAAIRGDRMAHQQEVQESA
jgi:hypothetical protein